jgi:long-subunit fatty acid transport protein
MELSAFYNSPLLDGTVLRADYYGASLGFSMPVLKSKGSLKISCTDIFNTQIFHNKTDGAGIRIDAYWKPESRFANILFTYRFGNLNVKANKNRSTGIEEEKSRMGNN